MMVKPMTYCEVSHFECNNCFKCESLSPPSGRTRTQRTGHTLSLVGALNPVCYNVGWTEHPENV